MDTMKEMMLEWLNHTYGMNSNNNDDKRNIKSLANLFIPLNL